MAGQVPADLPGAGAKDVHVVTSRVARLEAMAHRRDPLAVGAPARVLEQPLLAVADAHGLAAPGIDHGDIRAPHEVPVAAPVRDIRDPLAVRAPVWLLIDAAARGESPRRPILDIDDPQLGRMLVDETRTIELVVELVDEPGIPARRLARLSRRLRWLCGRGARDDAQPGAVGTPGELADVFGQVGQLVRLTARQGQQPDLAAPVWDVSSDRVLEAPGCCRRPGACQPYHVVRRHGEARHRDRSGRPASAHQGSTGGRHHDWRQASAAAPVRSHRRVRSRGRCDSR